jgi:hypothetical protein
MGVGTSPLRALVDSNRNQQARFRATMLRRLAKLVGPGEKLGYFWRP